MIVETVIAFIVSSLLSFTGLSAKADGCFIYVPSLNHKFIVTLTCVDWLGILLQASMYMFIMWVYFTANGYLIRRRTYFVLGITGFVAFFCANIGRMFTEIFLVVNVYYSVYQQYLIHWQAFEEQIGLGMMVSTLLILSLLSYSLFKRRFKEASLKPSF